MKQPVFINTESSHQMRQPFITRYNFPPLPLAYQAMAYTKCVSKLGWFEAKLCPFSFNPLPNLHRIQGSWWLYCSRQQPIYGHTQNIR